MGLTGSVGKVLAGLLVFVGFAVLTRPGGVCCVGVDVGVIFFSASPEGVFVLVGILVFVAVRVGVTVRVGVGVRVTVTVAVAVGVPVAVSCIPRTAYWAMVRPRDETIMARAIPSRDCMGTCERISSRNMM